MILKKQGMGICDVQIQFSNLKFTENLLVYWTKIWVFV